MITHTQKSRVYYSSVVPKAKQECNTSKGTAWCYFLKANSYQKVRANKSYADALKSEKKVLVNVKNSVSHCQQNNTSNSVKANVKIHTVKIPVNRVNATTRFTRIYKPQNQKPITLHNRFDVLQHIDTPQELDMQSVCYENKHVDRDDVGFSKVGVQTQLGTCFPALDGRSNLPLVGKKQNWVSRQGSFTHQACLYR